LSLGEDKADMETSVSNLLRGGIAISLVLLCGGTALTFIHHPDYALSASALQGLTRPGSGPHNVVEVLNGIAHLRGQAFAMLGLLALMATPALRVLVSLVIFARTGDRAFVLLTSAVLVLLLLSLLLGRAGG
jgi:uncharacterized membrane protein